MVSATGTTRCPDEDASTTDTLSIGDAGYRDNSGAGSVLDAWTALAPLVREYNATHAGASCRSSSRSTRATADWGRSHRHRTSRELVAPLLGATKVFSDLSYGPIEQVAAQFGQPLDPMSPSNTVTTIWRSRFFRVQLVDHPGVTAPLGWSFSRSAVNDLVAQLDLPENETTVRTLRRLLAPETDADKLTCTTSGRRR